MTSTAPTNRRDPALDQVPMSDFKVVKVRHDPAAKRDIEICYQTFGKETDQALILVMGLNQQAISWPEDMCRRIAVDGNFFVIRYDNREIGHSTKFDDQAAPPFWRFFLPKFTWPTPNFTLQCMVDDAIALLDHLKIQKAHWTGTSMGGMISQVAAITYPERVKSLCLLMTSSANNALPQQDWWVARLFLTMPPKNPTDEELVKFRMKLGKQIALRGVEHTDDWLESHLMNAVKRSKYLGTKRQLPAVVSAPCRRRGLTQIPDTIPTTVLHGMLDVIVKPHHGIELASLIPHSKLVLWDDFGHSFAPVHYQRLAEVIGETASREERTNKK